MSHLDDTNTENDAAETPEAKSTDNERSQHTKAASRRPRIRKASQRANYELSPRRWTDMVWEPADETLEATLTLDLADYLSWLASHRMERTVGVQPSASENPLSEYLGRVMGVQPRLQTDGHRAWFMLQLTKAMRDIRPCYLRLVLPPWATPLTLEYTAFEVGRTSGRPMQRSVSALEAFDDAQRAEKSQNI